MALAACESSDIHEAASLAQIRMRMESSTPRTTRASGGVAAIRCAMSPVLAECCSSAAVTAGSASGRLARTAASTSAVTWANSAVSSARSTITAAAAAATVVPYLAFSISDTTNSGRQRSSQPSRNVPALGALTTVPHPMPSSRSLCSSRDLPRSVSRRRSSSTCRSAAEGRNLSRLQVASKSACSGTVGTSSGTAPSSSPTTRLP